MRSGRHELSLVQIYHITRCDPIVCIVSLTPSFQSRMLHGQLRYGVPSRFLQKIPEKLLKQINAPIAQATTPSAWHEPQTLLSPSAETEDGQAFRIGQNVTHAKFGPGVIVHCHGRGVNAEVEVNFRQSGMKRLALQYAKLSAV